MTIMKNLIKIFTSLFFIALLSSCAKDVDPELNIYVSAKKSNRFSTISMNHGIIRFKENEDGGTVGISNLQNYNGIDINLDLTKDNNEVLVANESHWEGDFEGIQASLGNIVVGDSLNLGTLEDASNKFYGDSFKLEKNEKYRIDFIYDIDASVKEIDGLLKFDPKLEIKHTKL